MKAINVAEKLSSFDQQWHPRRIAKVDNMQVIVAKISGEFVWHKHDDEDEVFLVQKGTLEVESWGRVLTYNLRTLAGCMGICAVSASDLNNLGSQSTRWPRVFTTEVGRLLLPSDSALGE